MIKWTKKLRLILTVASAVFATNAIAQVDLSQRGSPSDSACEALHKTQSVALTKSDDTCTAQDAFTWGVELAEIDDTSARRANSSYKRLNSLHGRRVKAELSGLEIDGKSGQIVSIVKSKNGLDEHADYLSIDFPDSISNFEKLDRKLTSQFGPPTKLDGNETVWYVENAVERKDFAKVTTIRLTKAGTQRSKLVFDRMPSHRRGEILSPNTSGNKIKKPTLQPTLKGKGKPKQKDQAL